jgi:hypothetical protein
MPETAWRIGVVESELGVSEFIPDGLKPQVHQLTSAERRAAMLQRVRAKEAEAKASAAVGTADAEDATRGARVVPSRSRITGKRRLEGQVDAGAGETGAASKRHKATK